MQTRRLKFSRTQLVAFVIIFAAIGGYIIYRSLAAGLPVPVPAANVNGVTVGPGFVEASARQVIRTASNKVYVITSDDDPCLSTSSPTSGVIHVWKGTGAQAANPNVPTGFAEVDAAHHPVAGGSGSCQFSGGVTSELLSPESRLDASGTIQMAYIDGFNGNVYYQTFSTANDTWGARAVVATGALTNSGSGWPRAGHVSLALDSNDVPHIMYMSAGTSNSVKYINKVSGSWSTPVTVFSGTNEMHPSMVTSLDGSLHAAWLDNSLATHAVIKYAHYSGGAWGAVETVSSGDNAVLANGDDDQGPSIATDSQNRPHVLYMDGTVNGSDDYVRMRYRTSGGVWTDNTPPGGAGGVSNSAGTWFAHTPQNYISSTDDDWVFLGHDSNISPGGYQYQVGGPGNNWSAYSTIDPRNSTNTTAGAPGLDGSASIRWDPLRDNNPGLIDLIYYDENDGTAGYNHHATVYYKAVDISSMLPSGPTANIWVDTSGGTCTRNATPAAYSDASACGTISAAWTAAQPGDLIMVKGGTYSSGFSASGTKSSTVTIQAAPGENPWFAGDGSLSGVTNMTVKDDQPVTNPFSYTNPSNPGTGVAQGLTMGVENISGSSANINFQNIDLWCQDQAPWHLVSSTFGATECSARLNISGVDGFTMTGGSIGPETDCFNGCTNGTDINKISGCTNNTACQNITFNNVYFHDDRHYVADGGHTEMFKIDQGQNITFKNNLFLHCPTGCNSAVVFFGQNGSNDTSDLIYFIGNMIGNAGEGGKGVRYGYNVPAGRATTIQFLYNTSVQSLNVCGSDINNDNCGPGTGSLMPSTNIIFTGNTAYRQSYLGCSIGAYSKNLWFTTSSSTSVATCTGDNNGIAGINMATAFKDSSNDDYHLISGSPMIDKGGSTCSSADTSDIDGDSRPQGAACDVGADEYTAGTGGGPIQGDINSDGHVDITDLSILLSHYGQAATASQGDIDSDGTVTVLDLSILLSHYGT